MGLHTIEEWYGENRRNESQNDIICGYICVCVCFCVCPPSNSISIGAIARDGFYQVVMDKPDYIWLHL